MQRRDIAGILGMLAGLVLIVVVLVQGGYWLLTRPRYVSVTVDLPADQAWEPGGAERVTAASGAIAYDARWQQATLAVPSWDAVLTYMTDMLGEEGWLPAPPERWQGAGAYPDICQAIAEAHFAGQALLERRYFIPGEAAGPDAQPAAEPETACVLGWALEGGGFEVALVTVSAPHPNW